MSINKVWTLFQFRWTYLLLQNFQLHCDTTVIINRKDSTPLL